jgi:hypothetical protein
MKMMRVSSFMLQSSISILQKKISSALLTDIVVVLCYCES